MLTRILLLSTVSLASASLLSYGGLTHELSTPLMSEIVGPQYGGKTSVALSLSGPLLSIESNDDICLGTDISGSVAILQQLEEFNPERYARLANCAHARGAVAIIFGGGGTPGLFGRSRSLRYTNPKPVPIPVLTSGRDYDDAVAKFGNSSGITIDIVINNNEWTDTYDHLAIVFFNRILIPILAFMAAGVCLRSISRQLRVRRNQSNGDSDEWISTNSLILLIVWGEFALSCELFLYNVLGPMFSTRHMCHEAHAMFFDAPVVLSSGFSMFSVALFVRWGSFVGDGSRQRWEKAAVATGMAYVAIWLFLVLSWLGGSISWAVLVPAISLVGLVGGLISCVVFFVAGASFTRSIKHSVNVTESMRDRREALVKKFMRWITSVTAAKALCFVVVLAYGVTQDSYDTPLNIAILFIFLYPASIGQAYAQGIGLTPLAEVTEAAPTEAKPADLEQAALQNVYTPLPAQDVLLNIGNAL